MTTHPSHRGSLARAATACVAITLALTACGGSDAATDTPSSSGNSTTPAASQVDSALAAKVPANLKAKGKITAATEPFYPPFQVAGEDDTTLVGLNIDLGAAIGEVLGIKIEFIPAKFDAIIPGIAAGRYDIAIDAIGDKPARRDQVDFIDYVKSGSALFVPADNPKGINGLPSMCGHKIGVVKGTFEVDEAEDQAKECTSGSGGTLDVQVFPDQSAMVLALTSARVDSILLASAVGNYLAKESNGKFKQSGDLLSAGHQGIVVPKNNDGLRDAILGAVQKLMDNGRYREIFDKWNQSANAMTKATVNDGETAS